jgi:hypothetical protein
MIVVPVLMINWCVSLNPNITPAMAHMTIVNKAINEAHGDPVARDTRRAILENLSLIGDKRYHTPTHKQAKPDD